jgi:hypothetical protein
MASSRPVTHNQTIVPANASDFKELTRLLDKANEYSLEKSGEQVWGLREYALRELAEHLKDGACYVMRYKGKIVATMTITNEDWLWGDKSADGKALYIHKLMKDPECRILNIGLTFISFATHKALEQNKKFIRCDVISSQVQLVQYYLKLGFIEKATFTYRPSGRPGVFLEADAEKLISQIDKTLLATKKL